jgi:hypothetical protein
MNKIMKKLIILFLLSSILCFSQTGRTYGEILRRNPNAVYTMVNGQQAVVVKRNDPNLGSWKEVNYINSYGVCEAQVVVPNNTNTNRQMQEDLNPYANYNKLVSPTPPKVNNVPMITPEFNDVYVVPLTPIIFEP